MSVNPSINFEATEKTPMSINPSIDGDWSLNSTPMRRSHVRLSPDRLRGP
jgi:hypothetical protein